MKKRSLFLLSLLVLVFVLAGCSRLASEYEPGEMRGYRNSQEYGMAQADDGSSSGSAKDKQVFAPEHDRQNAEKPLESRGSEEPGEETSHMEENALFAETESDMHALNAESMPADEPSSESETESIAASASVQSNTPSSFVGGGPGNVAPSNGHTDPTTETPTASEETTTEETTTAEPESPTLPQGEGIPIDGNHFPDPAFRSYLMTLPGLEDGYLSDDDIASVDTLQLSDLGISSIEGLGYFSELVFLDATNNYIPSLDLSSNPKMQQVYVNNSGMTYLNVANNPSLMTLMVQGNNLSSVDVSNNPELLHLDVGINNIGYLDVSNNTLLSSLFCGSNHIEYLDLSNNPYLQLMNCSDNCLTELDLSGNPQMGSLYCQDNYITSLNISSNYELYWLWCDNNQISHIDLSNNHALVDVRLGGNPMTSLDLDSNPEYWASYAMPESIVYTSISPEDFNILDFDPYFDLSRVEYPRPWDDITFDENGNIVSGTTDISGLTKMEYEYHHTTGNACYMYVTIYFN